jgi:branched-subunit amino acid aminotransferase/4-amino-4-deoxychorismate lyase
VPGIQIAEKKLTPADLEDADEVFITSTTRNLLPVHEIEGKKIGRTDRTWRALSDEFGEYVDRYVAAHKTAAV